MRGRSLFGDVEGDRFLGCGSAMSFRGCGGRSGQHKLLRAIVPGIRGIIGGCDRCVMVYIYE